MKRIIGLIREPKEAGPNIDFLLQMTSDLSMDLQLLYIQNPMDYPLGTPGLTGAASAHVHASLSEQAEEGKKTLSLLTEESMKSTGINLSVSIESEVGVTGAVVDRHIGDPKQAMLTLRSQQSEGMWSQDATNMDIIRNTTCPVLIIPQNAKYQPFNEIEYATDYNEKDFAILKKLIKLMKPFSPHITAVHITDDDRMNERIKQAGFLDMAKKKTAYDKVSVKALIEKNGGDLGNLINSYGTLINANLIVVLKENHHFLDRIFKASATKKIIEQAKTPVLVYHVN